MAGARAWRYYQGQILGVPEVSTRITRVPWLLVYQRNNSRPPLRVGGQDGAAMPSKSPRANTATVTVGRGKVGCSGASCRHGMASIPDAGSYRDVRNSVRHHTTSITYCMYATLGTVHDVLTRPAVALEAREWTIHHQDLVYMMDIV